MSELSVSAPRIDEIPALRAIWKTVFGEVGEKAFFSHLFNAELCAVAKVGDAPAAMGFLVEAGDIVTCWTPELKATQKSNAAQTYKQGITDAPKAAHLPCAMIYAVATLSKHRGLGLGTAVVNELIIKARERGYPAVVLCPSDDSLFKYYSERTDLRDWFFVHEQIFENAPAMSRPAPIKRISADEYCTLRECLLHGKMHVRQNISLLEYQEKLCDELGGGLFQIGDSCAVVEQQPNGEIWIKELLVCGNDEANKVVSAVAGEFAATKYIVRTPANAKCGRRFGMIALRNDISIDINENTQPPWYGLAFD